HGFVASPGRGAHGGCPVGGTGSRDTGRAAIGHVVAAEPVEDGIQRGDFAATLVDPHVVVGELAPGAGTVLLAADVDQLEGLGALVDQFVEVGGIGGQMPTGQAG